MFLRLLVTLTEKLPSFRRWTWQRWYQHIAGYRNAEWSFMNYGFEPGDGRRRELEPTDEDDRYCIQLYDHVVAIDLSGRDALEVGSGRGGGASFMMRYHQPNSMTGVDFSAKQIAFCKQRHEVSGLRFEHGDAEALPFDDESFDAVINVESSHCYGSMQKFLTQVHRVLRPGGHFLFTDFRAAEDVAGLVEQLKASGLTIVEDETITHCVIRAMELDSERKQQLIGRNIRSWLSGIFKQFAGIKGSTVFQSFEDGTFVYKRFLLRKLQLAAAEPSLKPLLLRQMPEMPSKACIIARKKRNSGRRRVDW